MYFIYILESELNASYYVGYTNDVQRRLSDHNNSLHLSYTAKFRPWKIKAVFEIAGDVSVAMKAEKFIKKQKSRSFIDAICKKNTVQLPMAQLVRVPHMRD